MRTVTYGAACSLDGFIAAQDGSLDWLHFSPDVQEVMGAYWKGVDTILMGRKTWEVTVAMGGGKGGKDGKDGKDRKSGADEQGAKRKRRTGPTTYVFSRTLTELSQPGAALVSERAGEFVLDLKRREGKGICVMGGGDFARSLFEAGAIDEVGLNIHPVLLGAGVPLFLDAGRRVPLELIESRVLHGGCVLATYRVTR